MRADARELRRGAAAEGTSARVAFSSTLGMCGRYTRTGPLAVLPCLRPYPAEAMDGYTVTSLVSSVRNDEPELVRRLNFA